MIRIALSSLAVGVSILVLSGCATRPSITTVDLLEEMTDLGRLAELPSPSYRTVQFSSYDRRSSEPDGAGWYSNSDGFGSEPIPGFEGVVRAPGPDGVGEYLICDVQAPGAIVRTWTAQISGELRVHLDGSSTPLYAGPAAEFLFCPYTAIEKKYGDEAFIPEAALRQMQAAYCPIPFAKRCRITWIGKLKETHFYHVNIRIYEPGTQVESYVAADAGAAADDLETRRLFDARQRIIDEFIPRQADLGNPSERLAGSTRHAISATLPRGGAAEVLKLDGPHVIKQLELTVKASDRDRALRETVLTVSTEGRPWGDVQAPIGDFFGAAPGINPYDSLPMSVAPDGTMTCWFVMPCEKSIRIALENRGDQEVEVTGSAHAASYVWTDRSMHFRARWRVDHDLLGWGEKPQDMPYVIAGGAGRYVGSAVMLMNPCQSTTPWGGWWGEGDEKIYVDGDRRPSTFGTGSEDYFNYAWSVPDLFWYAYCGQPRNDGYGNRGFVTNFRWHVLDDLPFRDRFAFFLELFPHMKVPGMSYARIGYYYARPGTFDDHIAITDADLRHLELPERWHATPEYGLKDATIHEVESLLAADAKPTFATGRLWSEGKYVNWSLGSGEKLSLTFPVEKDGAYEIRFGCAVTDKGAALDLSLDGKELGFENASGLWLHQAHRTMAREFVSKKVTLTAGSHTVDLTLKNLPAGALADRMPGRPGNEVGIDYIAVKPVK